MYALGIWNFDIKPSNFMLDIYTNVYIIDCGSCKEEEVTKSQK